MFVSLHVSIQDSTSAEWDLPQHKPAWFANRSEIGCDMWGVLPFFTPAMKAQKDLVGGGRRACRVRSLKWESDHLLNDHPFQFNMRALLSITLYKRMLDSNHSQKFGDIVSLTGACRAPALFVRKILSSIALACIGKKIL